MIQVVSNVLTRSDGRVFLAGDHVELTVSAIHASSGEKIESSCPKTLGTTARKVTENACRITGAKDGKIFWERYIRAGGVTYSMRFSYDEALKTRMDPVVAHVNASWHYPPVESDGRLITNDDEDDTTEERDP